jgi:predicted chitinase
MTEHTINLKLENEKLILINTNLQIKIQELQNKLKKYTNPERNKKYYHTHKEELKKRNYKKSVQNKPSKEQKKIYNKRYYEKKKIEINANYIT